MVWVLIDTWLNEANTQLQINHINSHFLKILHNFFKGPQNSVNYSQVHDSIIASSPTHSYFFPQFTEWDLVSHLINSIQDHYIENNYLKTSRIISFLHPKNKIQKQGSKSLPAYNFYFKFILKASWYWVKCLCSWYTLNYAIKTKPLEFPEKYLNLSY